ncbi:putative DNA-directed DNA polymerase [Escherichia coli]|uniref:Putative DNA-directed DNA polymerase n=1 Tax=Escherichia coli TaxID=562 RepID=A0A377CEQ3_ECOLX|nr:putative DNA-directed DNA polymerase [Escherichia coli]
MSLKSALGHTLKPVNSGSRRNRHSGRLKTPPVFLQESCLKRSRFNCYHGGRNECFMMGVTPSDHWYDYDLAGAYTTGLLDILTPDYGNIRLSKNPGRLLWACDGICACHISVPGISSLSQPAGSDRSIWVILSIKWRIMGNGT